MNNLNNTSFDIDIEFDILYTTARLLKVFTWDKFSLSHLSLGKMSFNVL